MLKGLWNLTWLETKIFVREPLGVIGTVGVPVLVFAVIGRLMGRRMSTAPSTLPPAFSADVPVLAALLISVRALSASVASLCSTMRATSPFGRRTMRP